MVKDIKITDYNYTLPDERIARHPLAERDMCKLLVAGRSGAPRHISFRDLTGELEAPMLLVRNNTRVINARIKFRKPTGSVIETFLLEPIAPEDYNLMFQSRGSCRWSCLVGNLKRWKENPIAKKLQIGEKEVTLYAYRGESLPGNAHDIEFRWDDTTITFASIIEAAGFIPIPPYLKRDTEESDTADYQTVYAMKKGSVAAPTAGLHFTDEMFDKLQSQGIEVDNVTLHVGAGTFQPVKSEEIGDHPMHTETFSVDRELITSLISALEKGIPVTAVGTTSVRTLESLPYLGKHLKEGINPAVSQWEAYETPCDEAAMKEETIGWLQTILDEIDKTGDALTAATSIMIAPGFRWRIVDRMITNFHQPQSTLLLLVASFLGDVPASATPRWRELYSEAMEKGYRFLSYGDACLFTRSK